MSRSVLSQILLFVVIVELALPVALYLGRNHLIFYPSTRPGPEAGLGYLRGISEVEVLRIERPDGRRLAAYDVRPTTALSQGPVVVFFHGNAGNIAYRASLVEEFAEGVGARTVLFDYSGYGGNEGSPSEEEVYLDGLAVVDYLAEQGVPAQRIVYYGESLGGAVALHVAARRRCAGVAVQSSFSSLSSMALRVYPWLPLGAWLTRGSFRSVDHLAELEAPLLVAHGTRDRIIPFSEGEKLHAAAPPGTEFVAVEGAGHNDFFEVAGEEFLARLGDRFRRWTRQAS